MAKITYMPTAHDADVTTVDNITFNAYEAVELDDQKKADLISKLKRNPWFTDGEPDEDRAAAWKSARDAQAAAKEHRETADQLEKITHPKAPALTTATRRG